MRLVDVLSSDHVVPDLEASDRTSALERMAETLAVASQLPGDRILAALEQRERAGSTGIGRGVAIPHAKMGGLSQVVACFARAPAGVEFGAVDGGPVHLFLCLLAPEGKASVHLKALARASRVLQDADFRSRLMEAEAGQLFQIIEDRDRSLTT
ncbi:MAG: PTS sugar transporter subunit IIA [Myxococcota bacterium]